MVGSDRGRSASVGGVTCLRLRSSILLAQLGPEDIACQSALCEG